MIESDIIEIWPLSQNFEYAAEVGLSLRMRHPQIWKEYEEKKSGISLSQAEGYAFMVWLENNYELEQITSHVAGAILACGSRVQREVEASVAFSKRNLSPNETSTPLGHLNGERVLLYAPEDCLGYGPSAQTDKWTINALDGAIVERRASTPINLHDLNIVHDDDYLQNISNLAKRDNVRLTPETLLNANCEKTFLAACGAMKQASIDALSEQDGRPRLCMIHPGSHHAETRRGGGTCLVNNLAFAAMSVLNDGLAEKVAILDVDAHHGNGTEDIFRENPNIFTVSIHQEHPFFPGTGLRSEMGRGLGRGSNLNIPMPPQSIYRDGLDEALRAVRRFHPDLVLVELSADAHESDGVSDLLAQDNDFQHLAESLKGIPTVYELGASLSERAWLGALRGVIMGAERASRTPLSL